MFANYKQVEYFASYAHLVKECLCITVNCEAVYITCIMYV